MKNEEQFDNQHKIMNIDKMIEYWGEKHSSLLTEYGKVNANTDMMQMYRSQMKNILDFVDQLKQVKKYIIPTVSNNIVSVCDEQCTIHSVITSYTYDEKETKALSWFGVLTNMQKSKHSEKFFRKKSFELKPSDIITIWENVATDNWL